jgi:hypothetical protein
VVAHDGGQLLRADGEAALPRELRQRVLRLAGGYKLRISTSTLLGDFKIRSRKQQQIEPPQIECNAYIK